MSLKQSKTPYGYRNLLVYKKAGELQIECAKLAQRFPNTETLVKLADQMNRSARSTKQNIAEGWKRNTTREYYQFLGYAAASNAELEEDCNDIWKGIYPELMGIKGIMGDERGDERGEKGNEKGNEKGDERGEKGNEKGKRGGIGERGNEMGDIEKIPFYPLNPILPPIIRLKLRAKELNFLLDRLQRSLAGKMGGQGTLSTQDKLRIMKEQGKEEEKWYEQMLDAHGLTRLENGRVVKK